VLTKSSTVISSAGAPQLSGSIAERRPDNSLLRNYIMHL